VLSTKYEDFHTSNESIVIEYAATLFTQVCDRTQVPPPSCFLSLCRRCKVCPSSSESQELRSSESQELQDSNSNSPSGSPINSKDSSPTRSSSKQKVAPSSAPQSKKSNNNHKQSSSSSKKKEETGMELPSL
jgi:hypothetical protein